MKRIIQGDALERLRELPDRSVHCCVTSPPYFSLRDYGVEGQIGLEDSVHEYVDRLAGVFAEVRRVLRDDGTLWLNLGDTYAGSWGKYGDAGGGQREKQTDRFKRKAYRDTGLKPPSATPGDGIKPKDLFAQPWRLALRLQDDGWFLRADIIWQKKNPMPSSVKDRPTSAHEYIFLLAKQRFYYYDAEAIKER